MDPLAYILARGGDGIGELTGIIVLVVISLIGAAIQKYTQKAQQKQAEEENQRHRSEAEAQERRGANQPPPKIDERLARQHRRMIGLPEEEGPPPSPQPARPAPAKRISRSPVLTSQQATVDYDTERIRVGEEVERQKRRLEHEDQARQERMRTLVPDEADSAAIQARIMHIRPGLRGVVAVTTAEIPAHLPLSRENLRAAIVLYEILSPPKALRRGSEPWEQ